MAAYLFVAIKAHDLAWVDGYQTHVPGIMRKHGGEFVAVSDRIKRYEGAGPDPDRGVLMAFPSMEAIDAFVTDPEYRPFREARRAACSSDAYAFATAS